MKVPHLARRLEQISKETDIPLEIIRRKYVDGELDHMLGRLPAGIVERKILTVDEVKERWPDSHGLPYVIGADMAAPGTKDYTPEVRMIDRPLPRFGPEAEFSDQVLPGEFAGCT